MSFPIDSRWRIELHNYWGGWDGGGSSDWQITSSTDTTFEAKRVDNPDSPILYGEIRSGEPTTISMRVSMPYLWNTSFNGEEETAQPPVYKGGWSRANGDVMLGMGDFKLFQV